MAYTGDENHDISLQEAAAFTERYRNQMTHNQVKGGYFGKTVIQTILDQSGCAGIRYYYRLDQNGGQVLVPVGVNSEGNDQVNENLAEISLLCPPYCSADNDLNS